jgi:hypothetical protein
MNRRKPPPKKSYGGPKDDQALATLSPEQLKIARRRFEVSQEALRDFDQKHAAKSQRDEERRIANLSTKDLEALCRQGDEDARRRNG